MYTYIHNKVLDFVTLDNYKANLHNPNGLSIGQGSHTHQGHTSTPEQRWGKILFTKCVDQYSQ